MRDYSLTPKQCKKFAQLKRAFTECEKAGLYVWDDYGKISAVNGLVVKQVCPDESYDARLEDDSVSMFYPRCWGSSNADDPLFVSFW